MNEWVDYFSPERGEVVGRSRVETIETPLLREGVPSCDSAM